MDMIKFNKGQPVRVTIGGLKDKVGIVTTPRFRDSVVDFGKGFTGWGPTSTWWSVDNDDLEAIKSGDIMQLRADAERTFGAKPGSKAKVHDIDGELLDVVWTTETTQMNGKYNAKNFAMARALNVGDRVRIGDVPKTWWFKKGDVGTLLSAPSGFRFGVKFDTRRAHGIDTGYVNAEHVELYVAPPMPATLKAGDKVRCVKGNGAGFTANEVYEVGGRYHRDTDPSRLGVVKNDNGEPDGWLKERFEFVQAAPAKQKFNPGDRVKNQLGHYGTVREFNGEVYGVQWDVFGFYTGPVWDEEDLTLVPVIAATLEAKSEEVGTVNTTAPTKPDQFIIALLDNDKPRPALCPQIHTNWFAAESEAKRLAEKTPGDQFAVYKRVGAYAAAKPVAMQVSA